MFLKFFFFKLKLHHFPTLHIWMQFILTVLYHLSWIRALYYVHLSPSVHYWPTWILLYFVSNLSHPNSEIYSFFHLGCDSFHFFFSKSLLYRYLLKTFALSSFVFTFVSRQCASTYSRLTWGLNKPLWLCSPSIGTENNHFCHLTLAK